MVPATGWRAKAAADGRNRGHPGESPGRSHRRNQGNAIHTVQNRRQRFVRSRLPNQAGAQWGRRGHQESVAGQAFQGEIKTPTREEVTGIDPSRIANCKLCASSATQTLWNSKPSTIRTASG